MTYAELHNLTACQACGNEVPGLELFCANEEALDDPASWLCRNCTRASEPDWPEPEWDRIEASDEVPGEAN